MSVPHLSIDDLPNTVLDRETRSCLKLWAAVLNHGLQDVYAAYKQQDYEFDLAIYWFRQDDHDGIGSFPWLCELFGLDPDRARNVAMAGMKRMEDEKHERIKSRKAKKGAALEKAASDSEGLPEGVPPLFVDDGVSDVALCDSL